MEREKYGLYGSKTVEEGELTFFSLFFSVTSSLPAFAACRLSCFAVNWFDLRLISIVASL